MSQTITQRMNIKPLTILESERPAKFALVQEQLEHVEVSTALRYLGQYYFKNKLYDEASLCAQRCCDYNEVSKGHTLLILKPIQRS